MLLNDILTEIQVNGELHKAELASDNIMRYEVGTNGHMYQNGGHGTFAYVSLRDVACTNWNLIVEREEWGHLKGFKIFAEGDSELDMLGEAFLRIGETLKDMAGTLYEERKAGDRPVLNPDENEYWQKFFGKVGKGTMEEVNGLISMAKALKNNND